MTLAISEDEGRTWPHRRNLEVGDGYCMTNNSKEGLNREFSYPSIRQTPDRRLHITYTYWRQAIKYTRVAEDWARRTPRDRSVSVPKDHAMTPSDNASPGHAVVTGVSSGIGAAIAARLLRGGWTVTGLSRTEPADRTPGFSHRAVDLLDVSQLPKVLQGLRPTAIVHAAGLMRGGTLGALDAEAGRALWRLHVEAAFRLADALVPQMPDGGRIVLIGSRTATGAAGRSQYAATKAALVAMARSWALELAPRGITVNVVAPAATNTPMLHDSARSAVPPQRPPIGRFVEPSEVAALTAFLLGPEAGAITGQQIIVCGGSSL
jgi:NAD(P)-dependent dehydrogenase (short-subunit alcohol dehydrogenase family)